MADTAPTPGADNSSIGAPAPLTADQKPPAEAQKDPKPEGAGVAPNASADPPAKTKGKRTPIAWVQAGHPSLSIGKLYIVPNDLAEELRAAGRARIASDGEVKAAKAADVEVPFLETV